MLTEERYHYILQRLSQTGSVTVTELAERLVTSESTIRRDLNALDALGKLTKVHGGATAIAQNYGYIEHSPVSHAKCNVEEKEKIGCCAAQTVQPGDFIFLDAGTTVQKMIQHLPTQDLTVATTALGHAQELVQRGIRVLLIGGQINAATDAVVGTEAITSLERYHFTRCYLGTTGVSLHDGFTTLDLDEANLKQTVLRHTKTAYILADHTKFDQVSSVSFAQLSEACVITDHLYQEAYKEHGSIWEVDP